MKRFKTLIKDVKNSWKYRGKINSSFYDADIYWLDPRDIKYATKTGLNNQQFKNKVIRGDWDKPYYNFTDLDIYQSIQARITANISWEGTTAYKRILKQIEFGEEKWGCKNKTDLNARCKKIDALIQDIKENGYKADSDDEITINISRDGLLLLNHGRHRLACAKLLDIKKIPVQIVARHKDWVKFKKEILYYAWCNKGMVYAPLDHLDLIHIPSLHKGRFELIKANLDVCGGRVLDIGAHWGHFSSKFEDLGFESFAVEQNEECLYFLKRLKKSKAKKFHVIADDILAYGLRHNQFDVVLALSVFHWFIREKGTYERFKTFLNNLKMKEMFFQAYAQNHTQMQQAYKISLQRNLLNLLLIIPV
ncbi:MAG: methyltransferase domain-containing protein [Candidatus Omnitrophota bacterium]